MRCIEQALGRADIHQQHARRHLRSLFQRRQGLAVLARQLRAGLHAQFGEGFRSDPGASGPADEGHHVFAARHLSGEAGAGRQGQRLDADQLQAQIVMPP
ncbi:hypothetical protein D3C81_1768710 [compost metagenome]